MVVSPYHYFRRRPVPLSPESLLFHISLRTTERLLSPSPVFFSLALDCDLNPGCKFRSFMTLSAHLLVLLFLPHLEDDHRRHLMEQLRKAESETFLAPCACTRALVFSKQIRKYSMRFALLFYFLFLFLGYC